MLNRIIPEELIAKRNEAELVVYLKNGSIIQLKGADNPDSLRGAGPVGVVFDEFAKVKPDAWGVIEPILRANHGWAWFIGTPKGKNHLHEFYQRGLSGHHEWSSNLLKASTSGIILADQLEEAKKSMTDAMFRQEMECEFLEGVGQVFRGVREACTALPEPPKEGHYYVMGVDLAKHQDWTVVSVYDRETNSQVYQDRFQKIEWPFQKKKIVETCRHFNNALIVLDATGVGDPIADDLSREGVPLEAFKITEQSKKDLIEKHSIWIEQGRIKMLPMESTIFEHENFSYEITLLGKVRYGAPTGFNDDTVISNALAVWALNPLGGKSVPQIRTNIGAYYDRAKNNFDQDIVPWSDTGDIV